MQQGPPPCGRFVGPNGARRRPPLPRIDQPLSVRSLGAPVRAEGTRFFLAAPCASSRPAIRSCRSSAVGRRTIAAAGETACFGGQAPSTEGDAAFVSVAAGLGATGRPGGPSGGKRKNGADGNAAGFHPSPTLFATYLLIRETPHRAEVGRACARCLGEDSRCCRSGPDGNRRRAGDAQGTILKQERPDDVALP